jgi:hypothetical protein
MLIIAETKIDNSFPDAQFKIDNYHFSLVKQVGLLTRFTKSKISHTFFSGAPLCSESMS